MRSWWTVTQTCAWIATRDERLVRAVFGEDLAEADATISERTLFPIAEDGGLHKATVAESLPTLLEALRTGSIQGFGRAQSSGGLVRIPIEAWSAIEMSSPTISEMGKPNGRIISAQFWWDRLRIWDVQAMTVWSLPRRRQFANIHAMDFRPDSLGEEIWKGRRQRLLVGYPPMVLDLDTDGLPSKAEVTLTEALSWCAFGKALPVAAWSSDIMLEQADEAYAQARVNYANALYRYRQASREMKASGERHHSEKTVITRDVTLQMVAEYSKAEQAALAEFRLQASWRQLANDIYEEVRAEQNFSVDDKSFAQRLADRAEQELFAAFQNGDLLCLGRNDVSVPVWDSLPKDYFRFPIGVRLSHNILEPLDKISVDDRKMIIEHIAKWFDLRVNVGDLRRWHAKQVATFKNTEGLSVKGVLPVAEGRFEYVNVSRLDALRQFSDPKYDLRKLIRLCEELNSSFLNGNFFSTGMLVRAILDHVPPIFEFSKFKEVVAHYGNQSFKEAMQNLDFLLRKMADDYLHGTVRRHESLPNATQVYFAGPLDRLLGEIEGILGNRARQ